MASICVGGGIAGRAAFGLERQRHDGVARRPCGWRPNCRAKRAKRAVGSRALGELGRAVVERLDSRDSGSARAISATTAGSSASAPSLIALPLGLDLLREFLGAELVDQDLDARLVDVVAPAVLVVDAQDRLEVAQQIALAAGTA